MFVGLTRIVNSPDNILALAFVSVILDMLLGFDYAFQEKSKITDTTASASMLSGLFAIRVRPTNKFAISGRYEYHSDKDGFLSGTFLNSDNEFTGLEATGFTLGFEFKPVDFGYLRLDGRYLMAKDNQKIFFDNKNTRFESIFSVGASF